MARVFIGSTSRDLHPYRLAAIDECNRLGLVPIAMEYFTAIGVGATAGSRRKLDEADVYVGIFAHRYGYVEPGESASVTELEFDHAEKRGLERLCFLSDPAYDDPALLEHAEPEHRERMAAFRARVEASVIRDHFTTVLDFRGKVRLALQDWMRHTPELRGHHPALSFRLLEATPENRLRYGARRMPFVGRDREVAQLREFLDEERGLSWLVVAGPAGSGKSRLVQELCTAVSPPWRAGFLLTELPFQRWAEWRPEGPTLIAVDYASENIEEIRALLGALTHRGAEVFARTPVRILLIERAADGPWMETLIGNRSTGALLEQARSPSGTVHVGPLSDDELWDGVAAVLGDVGKMRGVARSDMLEAIHTLDPERRPLFALLAADAVAAGRNISEWDRERLLRDVLGREREAWEAHGVTPEYENLLALATIAGGLTEDVLDAPPEGVRLPAYRDFDRTVYRALTGADLEGDALPPLKPDLLAEFFVLEHVRGRNERITAQNARDLVTAAWRVRGGSRRTEPYGTVTYYLPSPVPLFLRRVLADYIDHPATPHLLVWPQGEDIDRHFWPEVAADAVARLAAAGRVSDALTRYDELAAVPETERDALLAARSTITAMFALLGQAAAGAPGVDVEALLARIRDVDLRTYDGTVTAFARGVANAVPALLAAERTDLIEPLLERVRGLVAEHEEEQELRHEYARALSLLVTAGHILDAREHALAQLKAFCQEHHEEVTLYVWLALAASALFHVYVADAARLADAESMNALVRALARMREQQRVVRYTSTPDGELPFTTDLFVDDLRTIRLELAQTNAMLVAPFVRAERYRDADWLIGEIQRISFANDPDFAAAWSLAVARHADEIARQGHFEQVPKALAAIAEAGRPYPEDPRFRRLVSTLALNTVKRASEAQNLPLAEELLANVAARAREHGDPRLIGDLAEGTLLLGTLYEEAGDRPAAVRIVQSGAWAMQSPAAAERWRENSREDALGDIAAWAAQLLAGDDLTAGTT